MLIAKKIDSANSVNQVSSYTTINVKYYIENYWTSGTTYNKFCFTVNEGETDGKLYEVIYIINGTAYLNEKSLSKDSEFKGDDNKVYSYYKAQYIDGIVAKSNS